jgi:hypothetical protein
MMAGFLQLPFPQPFRLEFLMQKPIALDSERLWIDAANGVAVLPISEENHDGIIRSPPAHGLTLVNRVSIWNSNRSIGYRDRSKPIACVKSGKL